MKKILIVLACFTVMSCATTTDQKFKPVILRGRYDLDVDTYLNFKFPDKNLQRVRRVVLKQVGLHAVFGEARQLQIHAFMNGKDQVQTFRYFIKGRVVYVEGSALTFFKESAFFLIKEDGRRLQLIIIRDLIGSLIDKIGIGGYFVKEALYGMHFVKTDPQKPAK